MANKPLQFLKKRPLVAAGATVAVAGLGYVGYRAYMRRRAFKLAADGNVNAIAAQRIGEMLPATWKASNWLLRSVTPSFLFKAAKDVEDFFRSSNFASRMFSVTETVTDVSQFNSCFFGMWGFSFVGALQKNLSPEEGAKVLGSLRREKVRSTPAPEFKGLYMVSDRELSPADVAVIINGSAFGIIKAIPAGMILGVSDGNKIAKGSIREGYTAKMTYKGAGQAVTVTVLADKSKVKFYPESTAKSKGFKAVPISYVKQ